MDALELELKHVKVLLKKAYEWRGKINKREHRLDFFKTQHAIKRFKRYIKATEVASEKYIPNKNEILLTPIWFSRCPPHNDDEKLIFTLIMLIFKLHKAKLSNLKKNTNI